MKHLSKLIIIVALLQTPLHLIAQTNQFLLNKEWSTQFGFPFSFNRASSELDINDNLITVSHSKNSNDKAVLLLTKINSGGQIIWDETFSLNIDNHSYGIDLALDVTGNIYVIGTGNSSPSGQGNLAFIILKYDPDGNLLWQTTVEGAGNGDDIPVGIAVASDNRVYVTGVARGTSNTLDYLTVCLSGQNGNILWTNAYDYNNLDDVPTGIKIGFGGQVVVTGGSGTSITNWEIATVSYDALTGLQQFENRLSNNGFGISIPSAFETAPNGDVFLTGSSVTSSTDFNIRTVKINGTNFITSWQETFELTGARDSSVTIKTDPSGNILVCGWSHEDFGDGTFSGSVVEDGKDFFGNIDVNADPNHAVHPHGTNVTGIIGAIRNNGIGIAGISGGENGSGGTRFVNCVVTNGPILLCDNLCAAYDAFINDELSANIINISASYSAGSGGDTDPVITEQEVREKLRLINRKGIIHIGSAGNSATGQPNYPAAAQDEWMINVSGSNQFGQVQGNNFGPTVDLIAPSNVDLVFTTTNSSDTAYSPFAGTSSAAPHAAGVAALLLAYDNGASNLTPDDIENILQASSTDVIDPVWNAGVGYDIHSGWGLLNAGAAINLIKKPDCGVHHFGTDVSDCEKTVELIVEDLPIFLREAFTNAAGIKFDDGSYTADVYKITADCNHVLPSPFSITKSWERHSTSSAFGLYEYEPNFYQMDALVPVEHVELVPPVSNTHASIVGYVYYLKNNPCTVEGWLPVPPEDADLTYSVLGCMTTGVKEEKLTDQIQVFPNPGTNLLTIRWKADAFSSDILLSLYSVSGALVSEKAQNTGLGIVQMDISAVPQGIYFLRCQTERGEQTIKITKL